MRLPSAYQEVEYIESSGSQRIDTGITPNDATYGFECKFNITNTSGDWGIMMACTQSVNHGRFGFAGYSTSNFQIGMPGVVDTITTITPAAGTDYEVKLNYNGDGKTSINGTVYSTLSPQGAETYSTPWTIFCYSYGTNSYARYGSFKLYYMKIYHGTALVRKLIPCYRKSDDVIGMYDTVNNTFYTNSGTGTFTKGANVEYPPEYKLHGAIQTFHRERPYEWEPGSNTVVYYDIDDNDTTTNIYDKSGNNYIQTWSGTAGYTTDADYGRVAAFDGSSYTQASSIVNFGSEYTFIALFKTTSTSSNVQAIVLECASTTVYPIGLGLNHGGAYDLHSSGQGNSYSHLSYGTAGQQIAGEWIMLVGTRDSNGNGKLYLNGNKIAEGTVVAPNYSTGEALQIGRWRNGDANYLNGQFKLFIGENRCWNDVEIKKFYNWYEAQHKIPSRKPSVDTLAYYPLDGNLNDYSGNGYNGTWANGTEKYTTLFSGIKVAEFSGGVSRVTTTFSGTPKTVSVWVCKSTKLGDTYPNDWKQIIGQNSADGGNGWIFRNVTNNDSSGSHILYADGNTYIDLPNTEYKDKWMHYLATVDENVTKFYLNGEYKGSINKAINVNRSLWMGTSPYDSNSRYTLYGYISEVILEDRGWTEQEILAYYEGTKDKYIPEASPAFEEQTFTYSAFGRNGSGQYGGDEETYTFQYPYENVIIDYTMQSTGTASSGGGQVTLTIYKNDVQVLQDVMGYYDLYKSGTFESISCEAGDVIKVRRDHIINARDGRQVDGTAHMNAT